MGLAGYICEEMRLPYCEQDIFSEAWTQEKQLTWVIIFQEKRHFEGFCGVVWIYQKTGHVKYAF